MIVMRTLIALLLVLLPLPVHAADAPRAWQEVIQESDRKRLAGLWRAWTRSLAEIDAAGQAEVVAALGPVLVPTAARPGSPPGPGDYRCRTVKLGVRRDPRAPLPANAPVLAAMPAAPCRITLRDDGLWFEQTGGSQRLGGTLFPDGDRMVFLGAMALSGEMGVMAYGADAARDQVGVLRAVGETRWRLELPWPMWQSNLEVIEVSVAE